MESNPKAARLLGTTAVTCVPNPATPCLAVETTVLPCTGGLSPVPSQRLLPCHLR